MGSLFQRHRQLILLSVLLIYALAQIVSAGKQERKDLNLFERLIMVVTSPPQELMTYLIDRANHLRLNYLYLVDARRNYLELLQRHRQLVLRLAAMEEAQHENARLRVLLGFKERTDLKMVPARVISLGTSTFTHSARIDKGRVDGLKIGMAVVTAEGIVGHIFNLTKHYANVLLLIDPNSSIDALDQYTRGRGIAQGTGTDRLSLEFVPHKEPIEVGAVLVSSGLDNLYPKGLPIGTVVARREDPAEVFVRIEVTPAVSFSRLEEVLVITTPVMAADYDLEVREGPPQ